MRNQFVCEVRARGSRIAKTKSERPDRAVFASHYSNGAGDFGSNYHHYYAAALRVWILFSLSELIDLAAGKSKVRLLVCFDLVARLQSQMMGKNNSHPLP